MGKIKKSSGVSHKFSSIRISFIVYVVISMMVAVGLVAATFSIVDDNDENVALHIVEDESDVERVNEEKGQLVDFNINYENVEGDFFDSFVIFYARNIYLLIAFVGYVLGFSCLTSLFFYYRKINKPVKILSEASKKIAKKDLDFKVEYKLNDEMGSLCDSFETMRATLVENNEKMWNLIEEQRRIHNAFSHDIRTPLTVINGYTDLLIERIPENQISEEKLMHTLELIRENLVRLENFTITMSKIQKLTDIEPTYQQGDLDEFFTMLCENTEMACDQKKFEFTFETDTQIARIPADFLKQIVMNFTSNACRFAEEKVTMNCKFANKVLVIQVHDDGEGFSKEALQHATKAYFSESNEHFGIGLHICTILSNKIGAKFRIFNDENGAVIEFIYDLNQDEKNKEV